MHIKKNNWNTNSISVLVKMHARHLRIWLYLHQHKLPSENKAQLISGSLICLDENEFLIDLVVRGIMQENEVAGCSHSGLLWRCLLVASRQEWCRVFSTDSKQRCQTVTGGESWGSWGDQETSPHWVFLATDLRPLPTSVHWPGLPPLFRLFPLISQ